MCTAEISFSLANKSVSLSFEKTESSKEAGGASPTEAYAFSAMLRKDSDGDFERETQITPRRIFLTSICIFSLTVNVL